MGDLKSEVSDSLRKQSAPPGALPLWEEIFSAHERGGPEAVSALLEKKVKSIRRAANVQASEMKAAAGSVARKARQKKRR
jgi:hypothetical protein